MGNMKTDSWSQTVSCGFLLERMQAAEEHVIICMRRPRLPSWVLHLF